MRIQQKQFSVRSIEKNLESQGYVKELSKLTKKKSPLSKVILQQWKLWFIIIDRSLMFK